MCEFDGSEVKYYLRGLCKESLHDKVYYLQQNNVDKPFFVGESSSKILWVICKAPKLIENFLIMSIHNRIMKLIPG